MSFEIKQSPMMAQWHSCRQKAPGCLLFFRLGDFYEAFYDDAILIAKELDLTLTKRQEIPMCGVPFHTSEAYIDKLVAKGYRVAVAEQMEDPRQGAGLVKREIVRVVSPGTLICSSLLSDKESNYVACICQINASFGLALLDLSTSDFKAFEVAQEKELFDELCRLRPKELLISEKWHLTHLAFLEELLEQMSCTIHSKPNWQFDTQTSCEYLLRHFHIHNLDGFGLKDQPSAINAAGVLLSYVHEDLNLAIDHIDKISTDAISSYLSLSQTTIRHLELLEPLSEGKKGGGLLYHLDKTETPMGGRLFKQWLTHPLLDIELIHRRQEAVGGFLEYYPKAEELTLLFKEVRDLERLIMRIGALYGGPRDLIALSLSLEMMPRIREKLSAFDHRLILIKEALEQFCDVQDVVDLIKNALVEAPPIRLNDGGLFKIGFNKELDELVTIKSDSQGWIARYQVDLREKTGIKSLKVGYTKAFGYYIEVSRGASDKMPSSFQRRQTLINAERFTTTELKEFEYKVLNAEERIRFIEKELFDILRKSVAQHAPKIRKIATAIAQIDCLLALAKTAHDYHYTKPLVDTDDRLIIKGGRHPIIERLLPSDTFIPNDVSFDETTRLILLTGPNMAGKSTYLRQIALIVIMAQIGSFVPAQEAHIGIVDKVFSRIGASDNLSRGQSTFMVEMAETANILHRATPRSLVILDEIGRGTSTYDGISIAWSVAEYLLTRKDKRAKTLFATHYFELTRMEGETQGAVNFHLSVLETDGSVVFLHKIARGAADKSYGIHVAKIAGLPKEVLGRANELLSKLEKLKKSKPARPSVSRKEQQLDFFGEPTDALTAKRLQILKDFDNLDLNTLTPLDAHRKLSEWKHWGQDSHVL
ncbi:MAG: DNA mismatch repair protein MutS [Anaerolineae bacterium]